MKWFRRMGHPEYRKLFRKSLWQQLQIHEITAGFCVRALFMVIVEGLVVFLTFNLLFEKKYAMCLFGLAIGVVIGFVLRSFYRTLRQPFRIADQTATQEIRRRYHL